MKRLKRIFLSALHALWMIILIFLWMRQPFISNYEFGVTKNMVEKEGLFTLKKDSTKEKYLKDLLFINTSHSLAAYDFAPSHWPSNVITDRAQLLSILKKLEENKDNFKVAFLDIFIDEIRPDSLGSIVDTELVEVAAKLKREKKLITVENVTNYYDISGSFFGSSINRHLKNELEINTNIFGDELSATAYYPPAMGRAFYRFEYQMNIEDKIRKQSPLEAYELITGESSRQPFLTNLFYKYEGKRGIFQNITIPRMYLKNKDLEEPLLLEDSEGNEIEKPLRVDMNLIDDEDDTLLADILEVFPGQIIIIGDFAFADNHKTLDGTISGPLIYTNTLLTLMEQKNKLNFPYLIYLFLSFTVVSYLAFFQGIFHRFQEKTERFSLIAFYYSRIIDNLQYVALFLAALLGIILFDSYLYFFFNLFYIFIISQTVAFRNFKKKRAAEKGL